VDRGRWKQGPLVALAALVLGVVIAQIAVAGGSPSGESSEIASLRRSNASLQHQINQVKAQIPNASTAKKKSKRGPPGPQGPAGAQGPLGPQGTTGPRGPSDVFEAVASNSFVAGLAGSTLGIQLTGLPAGSYAIYGKASIGPTTNNPGRDAGQCTLTADTTQDEAIDDWEAGETSFKTEDTELTHTFSATGSATLRCGFSSENFVMGRGSLVDTRIVAIRTDNGTVSPVPIG
jgi:hypothetical protein